MENYSTSKRKDIPTHTIMHSNPGEHSAKWKKPVSKRQMPYDATHEVSRLLKSTKTGGCGDWKWEKGRLVSRLMGRDLKFQKMKRVLETEQCT